MSLELSIKQRQHLKSLAHKLEPVVTIGDNGVSTSVLKEILLNLAAHELIKIKIRKDDKKGREAIANEICGSTNASLVQQIGKVLVLYLHNPEKKNNIAKLVSL